MSPVWLISVKLTDLYGVNECSKLSRFQCLILTRRSKGKATRRAALDNILEVTARLAFIRKLNLSRNMFSNINPAWIEHVARRVSGEKASEMRRHTETRQLALYAVYLMARETAITDDLPPAWSLVLM